ncbi:MAG: hypothetical protein RJQ08_12070 [Salinisphaeraceae bacterium]
MGREQLFEVTTAGALWPAKPGIDPAFERVEAALSRYTLEDRFFIQVHTEDRQQILQAVCYDDRIDLTVCQYRPGLSTWLRQMPHYQQLTCAARSAIRESLQHWIDAGALGHQNQTELATNLAYKALQFRLPGLTQDVPSLHLGQLYWRISDLVFQQQRLAAQREQSTLQRWAHALEWAFSEGHTLVDLVTSYLDEEMASEASVNQANQAHGQANQPPHHFRDASQGSLPHSEAIHRTIDFPTTGDGFRPTTLRAAGQE